MKILKNQLCHRIGLSLYRVVLAFLVIKNSIFYFPMADALFGADAIAPYPIYLNTMRVYFWEALIFAFDLPYAPQLFLLLVLLLAFAFMFGVFKRWTGALLFVLLMILKARNGFILDGSDNVIQVTLPFLVLADSYGYFVYRLPVLFSLPRLPLCVQKLLASMGRSISKLALVGLMVQICYVYFFTALAKLQGKLWLSGVAVYYTMRVEEFRATSWNIPLTENHYFVVLASYFTLFWELAFAFWVWFRPVKYFVLLLGVLLHLGIWIFMRIDNFSWIMMGSYFVFISDAEYRLFYKKLINKYHQCSLLRFLKMRNHNKS